MKLHRPTRRVWIILLAAAAFAWIYGPGLAKIVDLKKQERAVLRSVENLEGVNEELSQGIVELENDPLAVEREARRKLGLTRSKEVVYKVISEDELRRNRVE